jgi:hypothetical protein
MKDHQSNLVGMFLLLEATDHEHYRTGHLVAAVANCYLIQFDNMEDPEEHPLPPMELYTLEELSRTCENCGQKLANLFKSHADMMRRIAWLNQPEKPAGQSGKVVHLKKPH